VKIGVLVYHEGGKNALRACIDSVLRQSIQPNIIIIVDDASGDNITDYSNIDVHLKQNEFPAGLPAALLDICNSDDFPADVDVLAIVRSTDQYLPDKVSASLKEMDEHTGIVYSDYRTAVGDVLSPQYREPFSRDGPLNLGDDVVLKYKALKEAGLFSTMQELYLKITERYSAQHIPKVLTQECLKYQNHVKHQETKT
jgi:glycosyltransferase involved in cell wall biosynthesis